MARQWVATEPGPPEDWHFEETEVAPPGRGEVTIDVRAAGVNPADAKHVAVARAGSSFPTAIGYEVSGLLSAVGPATRIGSGPAAVGDAVLAFRVSGGYATSLTVPAEKVFHKPDTLSFPEAANLLLAATTAAEMLAVTRATSGDTIVLHGASGAVGVAVLQLAAREGVRVIGTASPAGADRVRRFGGTAVAYGDGLAARVVAAAAGAPIAAALDAVGTDEAIDVSLALVADRARIVTIAAVERARRDGIRWIAGALPESTRFRDSIRGELIRLAAAGELVVPLARTFPLEAAPEALALLATGHPGGKLALIP